MRSCFELLCAIADLPVEIVPGLDRMIVRVDRATWNEIKAAADQEVEYEGQR